MGWKDPHKELILEAACGLHPRALTCFETIKFPHHYTTYKDFESDLVAAIRTCNTGFGLVLKGTKRKMLEINLKFLVVVMF